MEAHGGGPDVGKLSAALDPREKIYRDPFNELVVFVISAAGAAAIVPTVLLLIGVAIGEEYDLLPFVVGSVILELVLIFGIARPQMKPRERVGWALLWGAAAAALGAAFWELTFTQIL